MANTPEQDGLRMNLDPATCKEFVYRTGQAAPIELPCKLEIAGLITAPARFVEKRRDTIDPLKCNVHVVREGNMITLSTDEKNIRQTTVIGRLHTNPDLDEFAINSNKMWGLKELVQFIRMRRSFFFHRDKHQLLIQSMDEYSAKVQQNIDMKNDRRGNSLSNVEKQVLTSVPLNFTLYMPIYQGEQPRSFDVDILCDVTDSTIKFWLESVDLAEGLIDDRNRIIDQELEKLTDYVIIEA